MTHTTSTVSRAAFCALALAAPDPAGATAVSKQAVLPLSFVANDGVASSPVRFLARGRGYGLFLTPDAAVLSLSGSRPSSHRRDETTGAGLLRLSLLGGRPRLIEGMEAQVARVHVLRGNDPAKWRRNLASFGRVRYSDVYPGVDLVFYGREGEVEYDFVVAPGRDPRVIRLGLEGAGAAEIDPRSGDLVLGLAAGEVRMRRPIAYQERDGRRTEVTARYVLLPPAHARAPRRLGFQVERYDRTLPLVIDPVLVYSSYIGGSVRSQPFGGPADSVYGVAADADGNAYITGGTSSLDFPEIPDTPATVRGTDVFVAKIDPQGQLVYSTFFGGTRGEAGRGIAVDGDGSAIVVGLTSSSTDFPRVNAAQPAYGGSFEDAFVTKLSPDGGELVYSTFLGGATGMTISGTCPADIEWGYAVAVDAQGNAYATGQTCAPNFPTTPGAYSRTRGGFHDDAFVTKYTPAGVVVYSTYLGGRFIDEGHGIAVDAGGNAYVTGTTSSPDFPITPGAPQPTASMPFDAFVTKLSSSGSALLYSTYLGGIQSDSGDGIAVDAQGQAHVVGHTYSADFPSVGALQGCPPPPPPFFPPSDAFVTKLSAAGDALIYSTCLGGPEYENASGVAIDEKGNAWVTGGTESLDFPVTGDALQPTFGGSFDAFVTAMKADGTGLLFSSYLGGTGGDGAAAIAQAKGNVYVAGTTNSTDFPVENPFQPTNEGGGDGFVARIQYNAPPNADGGGPYVVDEGSTVTLAATGTDPESGPVTLDWDLDGDGTFETSGANPSLTPDDGPALLNVAMRVTDDHGLTETSLTTVEVRNVAPTATFSNTSGPRLAGQPVNLVFTNATDPSAADAAALVYSYDCDGDGVFETADSSSASHTCFYALPGSYVARGRIEDKDLDFTDYEATVTILTPREGIDRCITCVTELVPGPLGRALVAVLQVAGRLLDLGRVDNAIRTLRLFMALVDIAARLGQISAADAAQLRECASDVIGALGG